MNAPHQTAEAVAAAIDALSVLFDNPNYLARERALRAVADGRAAYWSNANYSNQSALCVLDAANDFRLLTEAVVFVSGGKRSPGALAATLIPLNTEAKKQLLGFAL